MDSILEEFYETNDQNLIGRIGRYDFQCGFWNDYLWPFPQLGLSTRTHKYLEAHGWPTRCFFHGCQPGFEHHFGRGVHHNKKWSAWKMRLLQRGLFWSL